MRLAIYWATALTLACSLSWGADATETGCDVLAKGPSGKIETILPETKVLESTRANKTFSLVVPDGYSGAVVRCFRSDAVPDENDWKVVRAGYPLYITNDGTGQTIALELLNGQFQTRFLAGQFPKALREQLQKRLDQLQTSMQDFDQAAKTPNH